MMTAPRILLRCPFGGFTPVHPDNIRIERHPLIHHVAWATFDCTWCAAHEHPRGHTVQLEAHTAGDLATAGVRTVGLLSQAAKDAAAKILDHAATAFAAPLRTMDDEDLYAAITRPSH